MNKRLKTIIAILNSCRFSNFVSRFKIKAYSETKTEKINSAIINRAHNVIDIIAGISLVPFILIFEAFCITLLYLVAKIQMLFMPNEDSAVLYRIRSYARSYGYNYVAQLKCMEGDYFRNEPIIHPSAEVGIDAGITSYLHFNGKTFDYGFEYIEKTLRKNPYNHWKHKNACDFKALPLEDCSIQSLFSVHVVDHIPDQILKNEVLSEVNRVLVPGGKFVFSGFAEARKRMYLFTRLPRIVGLVKLSESLEETMMARMHSHNLLSRKQWDDHLLNKGFKIEKFVTFGGCFHTLALYNMHHFIHKSTASVKGLILNIRILRNVWCHLLDTIFLYAHTKDCELVNNSQNNVFFFIVARKI